ncbi:hypothetical protein HPB48_026741 [Haemaphysalis longicornis]|uniref:Uncharacterized protein n=1 Tax=Haemaphysalis longicornis TaxID=44386 RepID=A0A9J6HCY5_HAELO|nr:hypothetical protein HPB48_026741 [Haemaphysalis longicornis]
MKLAAELGVAVDGMNGLSPLINLKNFDIVRGQAVDYMHCVLLGVTRQLVGFWLDSPTSPTTKEASKKSSSASKKKNSSTLKKKDSSTSKKRRTHQPLRTCFTLPSAMFAVVRFTKDHGRLRLHVLPVSDVKNLDPAHLKDFSTKVLYSALWTAPTGLDTGNYTAQVLLLTKRREEAERRVAGGGERIVIPKIPELHDNADATCSEDEVGTERKEERGARCVHCQGRHKRGRVVFQLKRHKMYKCQGQQNNRGRVLLGILSLAAASGNNAYIYQGHAHNVPLVLVSDDVFHGSTRTMKAAYLPHVDTSYGAASSSTLTSPGDHMTVWLAAIKDGHGPTLFSGHGNPAVAMSPDTPLFVQVGDPKYGFHSNHLCIVVLPCPHTLGICASECFSVACFLLKLSGDVEENPGPVEDMIKEVLQSQREILAKITDIQEKQQASETAMSLVEKRLETIESKLLGVDEVNTRLVTLEGSMRNFDEQFNQMSKRIDDLENRSRRNNIIVRGIEEEELETEEVLIRKVNDEVFGNILKQKLHSIERIHRLGLSSTACDQLPETHAVFVDAIDAGPSTMAYKEFCGVDFAPVVDEVHAGECDSDFLKFFIG